MKKKELSKDEMKGLLILMELAGENDDEIADQLYVNAQQSLSDSTSKTMSAKQESELIDAYVKGCVNTLK